MIEINKKQNCCGCTACVAICPKDCIEMKEDKEGFLYPVIYKNKCINCGACERVCPILNVRREEPFEQVAYIVQNKDKKVLRESTAGGAFTAIAKYVLQCGGVVFGVELGQDLVARHVYIECESELSRFRNSKYVQSSVGGGTLRSVKFFLEQGKVVCFSGTPCQIAGLKSYLRKDYENLIAVDVVCRAVPSPLIFRKYVEYQENRMQETITSVRFRDKYYGYKYSTMNVITNRNQGNYHNGVESDPWLRAFFSNICDRPSCHQCEFRSRYHASDFTIWDCFHVGRFSKELDNDEGATRMLVHSYKGREIFESISQELKYIKISPDSAMKGVRESGQSPKPHELREAFFKDAVELNGQDLFNKYFPDTFEVKMKHFIRIICYRLGIYAMAKKIWVKVTGKY